MSDVRLSIMQSRALLFAVFPNYPELKPCHAAPPRDQWLTLPCRTQDSAGISEDPHLLGDQ